MKRALLLVFTLAGQMTFAQQQYQDLSTTVGFEHTGSGHGISVGDYDNDGLEDLYVARTNGANLLYHNNGDGTFSEMASTLGLAGNVSSPAGIWADIDNDGDLDLYVGNTNENDILYQNEGNGTFTNITESAGISNANTPRSVLFADVDMDGWLDIYLANISSENIYYHNNGDGTFTNLVVAAGLTDNQISMGAIFFDYDNDNDPDLYLTHDNNQANILYQNQGDGTFVNVAAETGCDYAGFGMGVDVGDINNDGWLDMYITNLSYNTLYVNEGGTFVNISENAGTNDVGMGWGTSFLDFNNDGAIDIYMANDSYFSPSPNVLYQNNGNQQFTIVSSEQAEGSLIGSYGTATLDFNNDGKIDIVMANTGANDACTYLENVHDNDNSWLKVKLIGTQSNRNAIGARITILSNAGTLTEEVAAGAGYGSSNSYWQHFGMGTDNWLSQMTVRWPNGQIDNYYDLALNQAITIVEGEGIVNTVAPTPEFTWQLGPNPAGDQFRILSADDLTVQAVRVWNLQGQTLYQKTINGYLNDQSISTSNWAAGTYFVGVLRNGNWEQRPLVVTKN